MMKPSNPKKLAVASAAAIAGLFLLGPGKAQAVLLSDLLFGGAEIIVNDKRFSDFQFEEDIGSKTVDTDLIDVTGLDDQPLNEGLKFTAHADALTVDAGDFIDFKFNFKVTVEDPEFRIKDASLALTEFVPDRDDLGLIHIVDFATDVNNLGLGTLEVFSDPFFGPLTDAVEFDRQAMVFQEIDIFVDSVVAPIGIIEFEVRKSQIPEPATLTLSVLGLAGLGLSRRRRKTARHAA